MNFRRWGYLALSRVTYYQSVASYTLKINNCVNYASHARSFSQKSNRQDKHIDYLYGHTVAIPALEQGRRAIHELLLFEGKAHLKKEKNIIEKIVNLAKEKGIPIIKTDKGELNNLTNNRPHQGVVLKASPLKSTPIQFLGKIERTNYITHGVEEHEFTMPEVGQPLWLALDEIQDPQNLGAILRTAHFFGIDGIVICSKNSAPLSPVVSKASAGALEVMSLHHTKSLLQFLSRSAEQGWTIVGAMAPPATFPNQSNAGSDKNPLPLNQFSKSTSKPLILVMGNEGKGLRPLVRRLCSQQVFIPHLNPRSESLNVSVATGILIHGLLQERLGS
ncbi:uncharacterized protein VTP21DRAFT_2892 [Calcarisporiella thermophila]|uniref:uncharacterized protein n=1 Tax=Calcarisporiella thermophila TaxID=911321 RepID=UPI003742B239